MYSDLLLYINIFIFTVYSDLHILIYKIYSDLLLCIHNLPLCIQTLYKYSLFGTSYIS